MQIEALLREDKEHETLEEALVAALNDTVLPGADVNVSFKTRNEEEVNYDFLSLPLITEIVNGHFRKHGLGIVDEIIFDPEKMTITIKRNIFHAKSRSKETFTYVHPADLSRMRGDVMKSWAASTTTSRRVTDYAFLHAHAHGDDGDDEAYHPGAGVAEKRIQRKQHIHQWWSVASLHETEHKLDDAGVSIEEWREEFSKRGDSVHTVSEDEYFYLLDQFIATRKGLHDDREHSVAAESS